jgi:ABC-type amino acid transport substrate-binding protein
MACGGIETADYTQDDLIEWTFPYVRTDTTVVYNKNRHDTKLRVFPKDVSGKIITLAMSSGEKDIVIMFDSIDRYDDIDSRIHFNIERDMVEVTSGRVQGVVLPKILAHRAVATDPKKLGMCRPLGVDTSFAFPCLRGSGLAALLNVHLAYLTHTGRLARMAKEHGITIGKDNTINAIPKMLPLRKDMVLQLKDITNKVMTIVTYPNFYPISFWDNKKHRFSGFDVDILTGFCAAVGLKPVFTKYTNYNQIHSMPGKWRERGDISCGGIGTLDKRISPTIEWSIPYARVERTVVYNLKDPIHHFPKDVHGKIVGTMGSVGEMNAIIRMENKRQLLEQRQDSTDEADINDLLSGKIQGLMRGSLVGQSIVKRYPKRLGMCKPWRYADMSSFPDGDEVFAFPCRRGSGLASLLNVYIMHLVHSGQIHRMAKRYGMEWDDPHI